MGTKFDGEFYALFAAALWTVTAIVFEKASKQIGSLNVNLIRLVFAAIFLSVYNYFTQGFFIPTNASNYQWIWLTASGFVGFVFGDYMLFKAFQVIGARISMLFMSLAPPMTAIIAYFFMGEKMTYQSIAGMIITITGIAIVIFQRKMNENGKNNKIGLTITVSGMLFGLGGALGQAVGLVLSKKGMQDLNAFSASQIRVIAAVFGFLLLFLIFNRWKSLFLALKNKFSIKMVGIGSVTGPFLGVSFSLLAIQNTNTGIAATLMAIVPILIIPPMIFIFKEKVSVKEIAGALVAVIGVALFFL